MTVYDYVGLAVLATMLVCTYIAGWGVGHRDAKQEAAEIERRPPMFRGSECGTWSLPPPDGSPATCSYCEWAAQQVAIAPRK